MGELIFGVAALVAIVCALVLFAVLLQEHQRKEQQRNSRKEDK